jgi:hypothetical protein
MFCENQLNKDTSQVSHLDPSLSLPAFLELGTAQGWMEYWRRGNPDFITQSQTGELD